MQSCAANNNVVLNAVIDKIDGFTLITGRAVAWLSFLMMFIMCTIVLLRYGFSYTNVAIQETALYLHTTVFMIGAAFTLQQEGHVRVDIFYQKMSVKWQAIVNIIGVCCLLIPTCVFLFIISFEYVIDSWEIKERSSEVGGLPLVYLLKSLLLVLPSLLGIQGVSQLLKAVVQIRTGVSIENAEEGSLLESSQVSHHRS